MDSKICVLDLFTGKYRNINLRNYDDDRQVGGALLRQSSIR